MRRYGEELPLLSTAKRDGSEVTDAQRAAVDELGPRLDRIVAEWSRLHPDALHVELELNVLWNHS